MERRYRVVVGVVFRMTDALVVVASWLASYWARFFLPSFRTSTELPPFGRYASLVPLVAALWTLVLSLSGVYESNRVRGRKQEVLLLWKAHFTAVLIFFAIAYLYDEYKYSRLVMLYFAALGAIALAVVRVAVLTTLRTLRQRGFNVRRVLVVGSGDAARTVVQTVSGLPELGLRVVGLLTQDGSSQGELTGVAVLGAFGDLKRVVEAEKPHQVLIALAPDQQAELTPMLACLTDATVAVHVVPDFRAFAALHCYAETFEGIPIIRLNESRMDALQAVAKRCLDIVVTAFALVVAAPLFVLLSALITLTSPGPVFYAQERMGLDGRTFRMFKFRSMHVDAEANSGAVWSRKVDDRRTPIGAFLRKTSLDELPQLWNVLRGDMSLVGPRPERPVFVEEFRRRIPAYMLRHKVKAGITGWAQVNGWRGDTSLVERTACDLYYIRNWSLTLDFKILAMTFLKGFVNKNAY